jgi:hypothetical protein
MGTNSEAVCICFQNPANRDFYHHGFTNKPVMVAAVDQLSMEQQGSHAGQLSDAAITAVRAAYASFLDALVT